MFSVEEWDFLYPARIDSSSLEHRMLHVAHTRKYIRLRIYLEEVGYYELSSTEVDEPVTDDGIFLRVYGHKIIYSFPSLFVYIVILNQEIKIDN